MLGCWIMAKRVFLQNIVSQWSWPFRYQKASVIFSHQTFGWNFATLNLDTKLCLLAVNAFCYVTLWPPYWGNSKDTVFTRSKQMDDRKTQGLWSSLTRCARSIMCLQTQLTLHALKIWKGSNTQSLIRRTGETVVYLKLPFCKQH